MRTLELTIGTPAVLGLLLAACGGATDRDAPAKLEAMALSEISCMTADDCCVVVDECLATAYVVGLSDYEKGRELAGGSSESCVRCMAPAIRVSCEDGACVGVEVDIDSDGGFHAGDHCGVALARGPENGAGLTPEGRIFGCSAE